MLWAIGAWLASGLIGGIWAKRKGHTTGEMIRDASSEFATENRDDTVYVRFMYPS